jgi:hypothetical protein
MAQTLKPAYGRDYKSGKAVQEAWDAGKDFIVSDFFSPDDGRYINKEDAERVGGIFNVRYNQNRMVKVIDVKLTRTDSENRLPT